MLFKERAYFQSPTLQIVGILPEALPKVVPGQKKNRHKRQDDEGEPGAQRAHRKKSKSGGEKRSKDSGEKIGTEIGDLFHWFAEGIEFFSRGSGFVIVGRKPVQMFQYFQPKRQDNLLRGRNRQPASQAREDDASLIAQEEKSDSGNEQPRVSVGENAIDEPSENERAKKPERAPKGERKETRSMEAPHGTKRGR